MARKELLVSFLLRIGLGIVFLYAATASFLTPDDWVGFFPTWLQDIVPGTVLLPIFSVYEIALALLLISGKKTFYAALLAALTLLWIILSNMNVAVLDTIFRDVAILFSALALAALHHKKSEIQSTKS